jgi:hypothetical protein
MFGAVKTRQAKTHLQWETVHVEIGLHRRVCCRHQHPFYGTGYYGGGGLGLIIVILLILVLLGRL